MKLELQVFGGRGSGSGAGGAEDDAATWERKSNATVDRLNDFLQGKGNDNAIDDENFRWERSKDIKEFKTVLEDAVSNGGVSEDDVFYIKYKDVGWVRLDSESDTSRLSVDTRKIEGAVIDSGWGTGFYGNTKELYAYNNTTASEYAKGYNNDFRWEFRSGSAPYAGHLNGEGKLSRHLSSGTKEFNQGYTTYRGKNYTLEYHSFTSRGKFHEYATADIDVSGYITRKR